jgi:hypothetical protein
MTAREIANFLTKTAVAFFVTIAMIYAASRLGPPDFGLHRGISNAPQVR